MGILKGLESDGLDEFLEAVRSSCRTHATRKGYMDGKGNALGSMTALLGVQQGHAIGEIASKLLEFKATPRKVLAEKIAGWAWRLWLTVDE